MSDSVDTAIRWLIGAVAVAFSAACFVWLLAVAFADPLKLNPAGCRNYASDAWRMAVMRDSGVSEEKAREIQEAKPYHKDVAPLALQLLKRVYASKLDKDTLAQLLLAECLENEGWIGGRDT